MAKQTFDCYLEELKCQRQAWRRKPVLRSLYHHWYRKCVAQFSDLGPLVEIGAGSGNFKEFYPSTIATDVFKTGEWIDAVVDAESLSLGAGTVGNILAFDVIHHLRRPMEFLDAALNALKCSGRLVLCEPAVSPWSQLVYRACHHEPIDLAWSPIDQSGGDAGEGHTFANMAIPEILFWKNRRDTLGRLGSVRIVTAEKFGFLLYPLTGGFSYRCLVPQFGFETLLRMEDAISTGALRSVTAMRMLVAIEKTAH